MIVFTFSRNKTMYLTSAHCLVTLFYNEQGTVPMVFHLTLVHILIFMSTMQVKCQPESSENNAEKPNSDVDESKEDNTEQPNSDVADVTTEQSSSSSITGQIVPVRYPFMVSLHIESDHFCTGTLVNNNWVLTSAYCISNESRRNEIAVLAGECQIYGHLLRQTRYPKKFVIHHGYDAEGHLGDVGMIWVNPPFHRSGCLSLAVLPQRPSLEVSLFDNDTVTTVKWNPEHDEKAQNHSLREENLRSIYSADCKSHYRPMEQPDYMFTCTTKSEKPDNFSDSGSPLLRDEVQIGIMTYMENRSEDSPQVYTRVDSFLHWIEITALGHGHINCAVVMLLTSSLSAGMILA